MAILGRAVVLERCLSIYCPALKPWMLTRSRNWRMGSMVFGLLFFNHSVSSEEIVSADRILGRVEGQLTWEGA